MSNLQADPDETVCRAASPNGPIRRLLPSRDVPLGGVRAMTVRRTLPHREVSTVGAWCFLDHFGPDPSPMRVLPHPHTGLQTVTWPFAGSIRHRDSLGNDVVVRPGELNLMTSGRGVAHSELSIADTGSELHGLQLWVALPDGALSGPSGFEQFTDLPLVETPTLSATVLVGQLHGQRSGVTTHTPLLGVDATLRPGAQQLELDESFEHAVLLIEGDLTVDGQPLPAAPLLYLGPGPTHISIATTAGARFVLLGGTPFEHDLVMWWNFIGRSHDDIVRDRTDWENHDERFGPVAGHGPDRIPAPPLPNARLLARRNPPIR